jgi:hypothetical protein
LRVLVELIVKRSFLFATLFSALSLIAIAQQDNPLALYQHPAIRYSTTAPTDRIATLNAQLESGAAALTFAPPGGYLKSALELLHVSTDSQLAVFSKTSLQSDLIAPKNPRAIYFSDDVAVGWVRNADTLELAAQDKQQGTIFYTLRQRAGGKPRFERSTDCLLCHLSPDTEGVPGFIMFSQYSIPTDQYSYATGAAIDHRTSYNERWGGWYVTGRPSGRHLGNILDLKGVEDAAKRPVRQLDSLAGEFDTSVYQTPFSDVAALMVLAHQARMADMLTHIGWVARAAAHPAAAAPRPPAAAGRPPAPASGPDLDAVATDVVDYMLFIDEAPLPGPIKASGPFAQRFASQGPRDRKGRSLRELDLQQRLLKYPCSYMVYSETFDALPTAAKQAIYRQLGRVLSGQATAARYKRLSAADRQAILDILAETKPDFTADFRR